MTQSEADAVIIGSGVCGAITAWQLACQGKRVLLLEAGTSHVDRSHLVDLFAGSVDQGLGSPYHDRRNDRFAPAPDTYEKHDGPYYVFGGPRTFQSTYVRRVGGTTWHFLGNTPRFVPNDFRLESRYGQGVDWPLGYDDLEPHYCRAEEWLGVSGDHEAWNVDALGRRSRPFPNREIWASYSDRLIAARIGDLSVEHTQVVLRTTPQARNSRPYDGRPACAGNSSCVPLCPIGAKYDGAVHVAKATKAGARLIAEAVVTKVAPTAEGVVVSYRHYDGSEHAAHARIAVIAANAIETPRLLLMSGLCRSSGQVGRNLMDHLQGTVAASAPEPVFPYRGPPTTSGIDAFRDGSFRSESGAFRLSLGNDGWGRGDHPTDRLRSLLDRGLVGTALRNELERQTVRLIRFSYSTEMLPRGENRVELAQEVDALGLPRPKLFFSIDDYSRAAFKHAQEVCREIFDAAGCEDIHVLPVGIDGVGKKDQFLGAGHISGTCRMGADPATSVVDAYCRAHDHERLYILGSSVFPTEGTANPTLTAVALLSRALGSITDALESRA
jgi:choline dehydrogenase-like flavoprotein